MKTIAAALMRLGPALRKGIPVKVTCDGPAETSSILTIQSRRQRERWFRRYAKTSFRVLLGVERTPPYHTSVDSGRTITVVR
jgi:hypothetical protein